MEEFPFLNLPEPPVIKKRKKQQRATEERKATKAYQEYRKKNTAAAREYRDRKREEKKIKTKLLENIEAQNKVLRERVLFLELELDALKLDFFI
tara:strand:+ start:692 stop:973 length:282 start_codon:yes stop_codon:yes gene_type:complete